VEDLPRVQLLDEPQVDNLVPNLGIHETEEVSVQSLQGTLHEIALNPYNERQTGAAHHTPL